MKKRTIHYVAGFWLALGVGAQAAAVFEGFDMFTTPDDGSSFVDLSAFGLSNNVPLEGNPDFLPGLGNTDTLVVRKQPLNPFDVNPPGPDMGTIDIELIALSLVSSNPVDLTPLGGPFVGVFSDLYITLNNTTPYFDAVGSAVYDGSGVTNKFPDLPQPDVLPLSTGTMDLVHDNPDGVFPNDGTFASDFPNIFADAIFTVVGGDPNDPFDVLLNQAAPAITLSSTGGWTHTVPPAGSDPHTTMMPAGDFYITSIIHTGPHAPTIAVPEPSAMLLLAAGLVGFLTRRRRA